MTTIVLLAAGSSQRFGPSCKLQALYRGKPLVRHAADEILKTGFPAVAVISNPDVAALLPEFRIVRSYGNQSQSLRAGIGQVSGDAAMIVLGDMPHVNSDLMMRVATATAPAAATDGTRITPPTMIPRSLFPDIELLSGDRGAMSVLKGRIDLVLVQTEMSMLLDVDHQRDIQ